ncbi:hypothetical protein RFI_07435, partial [Reticulomyxa filosa]
MNLVKEQEMLGQHFETVLRNMCEENHLTSDHFDKAFEGVLLMKWTNLTHASSMTAQEQHLYLISYFWGLFQSNLHFDVVDVYVPGYIRVCTVEMKIKASSKYHQSEMEDVGTAVAHRISQCYFFNRRVQIKFFKRRSIQNKIMNIIYIYCSLSYRLVNINPLLSKKTVEIWLMKQLKKKHQLGSQFEVRESYWQWKPQRCTYASMAYIFFNQEKRACEKVLRLIERAQIGLIDQHDSTKHGNVNKSGTSKENKRNDANENNAVEILKKYFKPFTNIEFSSNPRMVFFQRDPIIQQVMPKVTRTALKTIWAITTQMVTMIITTMTKTMAI